MALGPPPRFNFSPGDQIFLRSGNGNLQKYHNIGQLRTPYVDKHSNFASAQGDYGPPQNTKYYTVHNPLYPYPMMSDWQPTQYLPLGNCAFGSPGQFVVSDNTNPDSGFVPPNYFSPTTHMPSGHNINPSQTYDKKLIQNMTMPVQEDIMPIEGFCNSCGSTRNREKFKYVDNAQMFHIGQQYEGEYVKLMDIYPRLQKNMPPYKDGEKWKY